MKSPRLLIVSYWFPPFQTIGSERLASFARHLSDSGWEVAVLTVADSVSAFAGKRTDPLDNRVVVQRLPGFSWAELAKRLGKGKLGGNTAISAGAANTSNIAKRFAFRIYNDVLCFPDECWPWAFLGKRKGIAFAQSFKPDVILSSAMPMSSHVLAAAIQKAVPCKWVADYRDYWTGHPFRQRSDSAEQKAQRFEQKTLRGANLVLSVSEPYAENLVLSLEKPAKVIYNGFEQENYSHAKRNDHDAIFRIVYTGMIYGDLQNPQVFLDGFKVFIQESQLKPAEISFQYRGPNNRQLTELAERMELIEFCDIQASVPKTEALALQVSADALLFLTFSVNGWLSGKFMEYLGSGKPILAAGPEEPECKRILGETNTGVICNDPKEVAAALKTLYGENESLRRDSKECLSYSRESQAAKLHKALLSLLDE